MKTTRGGITQAQALSGRSQVVAVAERHAVLDTVLKPPFPVACQLLWLGMGCFWGAERRFWSLPGVYSTAVGYAGGFTMNPTYEDVCSGLTGHTEVVQVVYDPVQLPLAELLRVFWESHDPTQGFRQGNDHGPQYRSALYAQDDELLPVLQQSANRYQQALHLAGYGAITTEIARLPYFYYAEAYHQQYLHKNLNGYCGLRGTGVSALS